MPSQSRFYPPLPGFYEPSCMHTREYDYLYLQSHDDHMSAPPREEQLWAVLHLDVVAMRRVGRKSPLNILRELGGRPWSGESKNPPNPLRPPGHIPGVMN